MQECYLYLYCFLLFCFHFGENDNVPSHNCNKLNKFQKDPPHIEGTLNLGHKRGNYSVEKSFEGEDSYSASRSCDPDFKAAICPRIFFSQNDHSFHGSFFHD